MEQGWARWAWPETPNGWISKNVAVFQQFIKARIEKSGAERTGQSKDCSACLGKRKWLSPRRWAERDRAPSPPRRGRSAGRLGRPDLGGPRLGEVEPRALSLRPPSLPPSHSWAKQAKGCGSCGGARGRPVSWSGRWACRGPGRVPDPRGVRRASQLSEGTPERAGPRGHLYASVGETGVTLPLRPLHSTPGHLPAWGLCLSGHHVCRARPGKTGTVPSLPRKF